jgi:hypothetical protein
VPSKRNSWFADLNPIAEDLDSLIKFRAGPHSTELGGIERNGSSDTILTTDYSVTFCQEVPPLSDTSYSLDEVKFQPWKVCKRGADPTLR